MISSGTDSKNLSDFIAENIPAGYFDDPEDVA